MVTETKQITDFRFRIRYEIGKYYSLYRLLMLTKPSAARLLVDQQTDIVIEGYPRSGNTFAVAAFMFVQIQPVRIARHRHVTCQIKQATKQGKPTIIIARSPAETVASLLIREPLIMPETALKTYINYYSTAIKFKNAIISTSFEKIISDYGLVINDANQKFNTRFVPYNHTEENNREVFSMIEQMDKDDTGQNQVTSTSVSRPSEAREFSKKQWVEKLNAPDYSSLLLQAEKIYDEFIT